MITVPRRPPSPGGPDRPDRSPRARRAPVGLDVLECVGSSPHGDPTYRHTTRQITLRCNPDLAPADGSAPASDEIRLCVMKGT